MAVRIASDSRSSCLSTTVHVFSSGLLIGLESWAGPEFGRPIRPIRPIRLIRPIRPIRAGSADLGDQCLEKARAWPQTLAGS